MSDTSGFESENYQAARAAKPFKQRGKGSVARNNERFVNRIQDERRAAIDAKLNPELALAYESYVSHGEQGVATTKVVPVTTRGIGLNTQKFLDDADNFVIESVKPLRADVFQLYRYSLMQLGRQLCLNDFTPVHVMSNLADVIPANKIQAFNSKENGAVIADAINEVGSFKHQDQEHIAYVPQMFIDYTAEIPSSSTIGEPTYDGSLEADSCPARTRAMTLNIRKKLPDPFTITIFNLRDAVEQLSNVTTPMNVVNAFKSRNPIPGARFDNNGRLSNPDEIMPTHYLAYRNQLFEQDIQACRGLFRQVHQVCPSSIGQVNMDGKGSPICLSTTMTTIETEFRVERVLRNGQCNDYIYCSDHSQTYAVGVVDKIARLRGYVNLMGEIPIHPMRTAFPVELSTRHPDLSVHSSVSRWSRMASDLSPFSRKLA